jgi:hypothetical protein
MSKLDLINFKNLINKIDMNNINIKLIKSNVNYLINIYKKIKEIWISLNNNFKNSIINKNDTDYNYIKSKITKSVLVEYETFNNFIKENKELLCFEYENIKLYYFYSVGKELNDINKIIKLLKITICINKFYIKNDNIDRIIIWIPIPKRRDFNYNEINDINLDKSYNNFGAFTVSGLTFGDNPRITIITRYEEIEKLLIHELVHNFYIDGSMYHNNFNNLINKYEKIKNKSMLIKNYNYTYSIYESYSELTGTYLMLLFNNIDEKIERMKDKLLSNIIIELVYSYNTIVNIAKLNKYKSWKEFIKHESFYGNICIYEYYYIKGIMYNNFNFRICNNIDEFINLYNEIIKIMQNTENEKLLMDIFNIFVKQENYKYMLLN